MPRHAFLKNAGPIRSLGGDCMCLTGYAMPNFGASTHPEVFCIITYAYSDTVSAHHGLKGAFYMLTCSRCR